MPRRWQVKLPRDDDDERSDYAVVGWRAETYYAVVESYRDDKGRPRHRTVATLGTAPTPEARAGDLRMEAGFAREDAAYLTSRADFYAGRAAEAAAELEAGAGEVAQWVGVELVGRRQSLEWSIERDTTAAESFRVEADEWDRKVAALEAEAAHLEAIQRQFDAGARAS
jgi:hypothetical protein